MIKMGSKLLNILMVIRRHTFIRKYKTDLLGDKNLIIGIDKSWSNDYSIGIQGWVFHKQEPLDKVELYVGDASVPISSWHPRPDVAAMYPQYKFTSNCGFWAQVPRKTEHAVTFKTYYRNKITTRNLSFTGFKPKSTMGPPKGGNPHDDFVKIVNESRLSVLEIGSRVVGPFEINTRALFPNASSYTGFDYYPDSNTDVVGDAHSLSHYFPSKRFGAIFSVAVFEHLAMPWVVAIEINKLLEIGGVTYHLTHPAWPLHERPWDFWRFSDDGLRVLFSKPMGFEIIKVAFFAPLRMHMDDLQKGYENMPVEESFGGVQILARKIADVDTDRFKWDTTIEEVLGSNSHYPQPKTTGLQERQKI